MHMQVNKYIHPCQMIPFNLSRSEAKKLLGEYQISDVSESMSKSMLEYFARIDAWLLDRFIFGDYPEQFGGGKRRSRLNRFTEDYLKDGCDSEEEENLATQMFF